MVNSSAVLSQVLTLVGSRGRAVSADVDGLASVLVKVVSNVLHAGGVRNASFESVVVDLRGISSVARASSLAVHNHLGGESDGGKLGSLVVVPEVHDVESVGKGRGGSLGPAGTAVLRNVLVLVPGKQVPGSAVSRVGSPVNSLGQLVGRQHLPTSEAVSGVNSGGLGDSAASLLSLKEGGAHLRVRSVLCLVGVSGVVLLIVSGLVGELVGPGVDWDSELALTLDGDVVHASHHSEESVLSPVGSPRVSNEPVLGSVLNSVSNHGNVVDNVQVSSGVVEDSASVLLESIRDGNSAGNGSSVVDFLHHGLFANDVAVLGNLVDGVLVGHEAGLVRVAVLALHDGGALQAVVVASSLVSGAGFVGDFVVVDPLEGVEGVSSMAAEVWVFARDQNLRRKVDFGPLGLPHDLDSVRKRGSCGLSPAGAAVFGQVLLSHGGQVVDSVHVVPSVLGGH